ncbi:hypothetical protein OTK49_01275 [Vibrio coralliirubri]|uniref:hypothetical protein n=1 Tax=Vibrio coralliirubri TaxID=1516159 RepID=UPI002284378B|nr:hypothetical protein [Vibrio coralliirubri]MCY9861160.1 hypothetical protein [Vibrio coralliirubri]
MTIIINNKAVTITPIRPKECGGKETLKYTYKAFSLKNGETTDDNWKFFEDEIRKDEYLNDCRDTLCSSLFYQLSANANWDFVGGRADQWGCLILKNFETKNIIYVEFDYFEHGLMAAYLIAKNINPEDF